MKPKTKQHSTQKRVDAPRKPAVKSQSADKEWTKGAKSEKSYKRVDRVDARKPVERSQSVDKAPIKSGKTEKAYKLLALQEGISAGKAKDLIDRGLVSVSGKRLSIARGEIATDSTFKVEIPKKCRRVFEDDNLLVLNKPAFVNSEEVANDYVYPLLHRLDRETSGILMLVKNEPFREKAIEAFKKHQVIKEYIAVVEGKICEACTIDQPIATDKGAFAKSRISAKGKPAKTVVEPLEMVGKLTKVRVIIETGRTHQIRVHLSHIGHPIVGDKTYGSTKDSKRMMLHAARVEIFDYKFKVEEPEDFNIQ